MIKVYGLNNCDACRKARRYLDAQGAEYRFVDLRAEPPQPGQVRAWLAILGEENCSIGAAPPGASWMRRSSCRRDS